MKILLVQTSFLGDTVLSTPVIAGLRSLYPQSNIWMMTTKAASEVIKRDPLLAGVIAYDKRGRDAGISGLLGVIRTVRAHRFDRIYSLHRSYRTALLIGASGCRNRIGFNEAGCSFLYSDTVARIPDSEKSGEHDVIRNLRILSAEKSPEELPQDLRLTAPEELEISPILSENKGNLPGAFVLFPGSVWKTKRWKWEGFREVAEHYIKLGRQVVIAGSPEETEICNRVAQDLKALNVAGKTSAADVLYLISKAALVVCNDSFPLHVASAFKVPTTVIFCATSPEFGFGPWNDRAEVVEMQGLECKPCRRHGSQRCPTGTEACMRDLESRTVIESTERVLAL